MHFMFDIIFIVSLVIHLQLLFQLAQKIIYGRKVQLCKNTASHAEVFIPNVTYVTFQNY